MRVLHVLDLALPTTLSWVDALLSAQARTLNVLVASPWMVQNAFYRPETRQYVLSPLQRALFPALVDEFAHPLAQKVVLALEKRLPWYRNALYCKLKHNPPDVVHAHFGPIGCHYLPLAKRFNRPLVCTFYGFDYTKTPSLRPVYRTRYRRLFAEAAALVVASPEGANKLVGMGCDPSKTRVVPPSVPYGRFESVPSPVKSPQTLRLVQLASFTAKKGHLDTLEAFRKALAVAPDMHLTLAGESVQPEVVRAVDAFVAAHRLAEKVVRRPFVPNHAVGAFLSGFHAFIHPSRTAPDGDHEASPVVVLEAQACGLPVVATRHMDLPRQVVDGQTGLLADEGDTEALAAHLVRLYGMGASEYARWSAAARRHVAQHYALETSEGLLRQVYEAAVSHHRTPLA